MADRDWRDAEAKRTFCRCCGTGQNVQLAHVAGRRFDRPKRPGVRLLWVNPDDVIPLCGPFANDCHGRFDRHEMDLGYGALTGAETEAALTHLSAEELRMRVLPGLYDSRKVRKA